LRRKREKKRRIRIRIKVSVCYDDDDDDAIPVISNSRDETKQKKHNVQHSFSISSDTANIVCFFFEKEINSILPLKECENEERGLLFLFFIEIPIMLLLDLRHLCFFLNTPKKYITQTLALEPST
jgi:hypothetical protein